MRDSAVSRPYHHGSLRRTLVDCAAQLASQHGVAAVSLRAVARTAGVSQAAPYHYFSSKSALLAAVAEEGFHLFETAQIAALANADAGPADRLDAISAAYVRFAIDRPHYFNVMFRRHVVEPRKYPALVEVASRTFDRMVDTVRAARLAFGHDDNDPHAAALGIWAVPHGLAVLYLDGALAPQITPRGLENLARTTTRALAAATLTDLDLTEVHWGV